jgi:hypothetical protein
MGEAARIMYHYTDRSSLKAISSQVDWMFVASQPPGQHPKGAYFTTLGPETMNLALRLGIPREKTEHYFSFVDSGDLEPLRGGRGKYIFFSTADYCVESKRQREFK